MSRLRTWTVLFLLASTLGTAAAVTEPDPAEGEDGEYPEALEVRDDTVYPEFPDAPADAPEARLRVVFDLVSMSTEIHAEARTPFDFYVVAHDVQVALRAWEAHVVVDPRLLVIEREFDGLNVGRDNEIITALKPRNCKVGTPITLARFRAMVPEEGLTDLVIGLGPIGRSSFDPPTPGYLICRPGSDLRTFAACDTCAVVNPASVRPETDEESPLSDILQPIRGR